MPKTIRPVGSEPVLAAATPASNPIHASAATTKRFIGRNLHRPCYGGVTISAAFCDAANRYLGRHGARLRSLVGGPSPERARPPGADRRAGRLHVRARLRPL